MYAPVSEVHVTSADGHTASHTVKVEHAIFRLSCPHLQHEARLWFALLQADPHTFREGGCVGVGSTQTNRQEKEGSFLYDARPTN